MTNVEDTGPRYLADLGQTQYRFPNGYALDSDGVAGLGTMLTWSETVARATVNGLHPEFLRRVRALMFACARRGVPLGIGTGLRTSAEQAAGHARDPDGHAAAGHSNHEGFGPGGRDAIAADMVPSASWAVMELLIAAHGLRSFNVPSSSGYSGRWDAPHLQPIEVPAARVARSTPWVLEVWPLPDAADLDPIVDQEVTVTSARLVRIRGYANAYLIGAGPALWLPGPLFVSLQTDIPVVEVELSAALLAAWGIDPDSLVAL